MSKIKEIQSRLEKNPTEYTYLRLLVAAQIFSTSFALYFLVFLFTIGGFYFWIFSVDTLAIIRYHLYSLLVLSTAFFGYSLTEYLVAIYFGNKKIITLIVGIFFVLFSLFALSTHLGLISSLL